jgi:1,4-alpha-glucan branching enzyme
MLRRLAEEELRFKIAISLTPTLGAMLDDELLRQRYQRYLARRIALAEQEIERHRSHPQLLELAQFYAGFFRETLDFYDQTLSCDVVGAFRQLQDADYLEILSSAATHAFLPLLHDLPEAQRAQIQIGCDAYRKMFGCEPDGFWLPECGYSSGLDAKLQAANLRWFVLDSHGLMLGQPRPQRAIFAPCYTPAGPAAFARDRESNLEVWSAQSGYPGDAVYRDFYRDIGFERTEEELAPFLLPAGVRKFSGIKYHRVTGREEKEIYERSTALARAAEHADDFYRKCARRFRALTKSGPNPVIVSPFDAELFGHWWFEGPHFLEHFIRQSAAPASEFELTTPGDFLRGHPAQQIVRPNPSSWGERGFSGVWLDEKNAWIYPHLHGASRRMTNIARRYQETQSAGTLRALKQAARELLLAQASDWAFLIKTDSAPDYARRRTEDHLLNFNRLYQRLDTGEIDFSFLEKREAQANLFPDLNWRYYL